MKFDSSKLKGRIREKKHTQESMANNLEISSSTFNLKLNGNAFFTQDEIYIISNLLDIPKEQYFDYFFTLEVEKTKQK